MRLDFCAGVGALTSKGKGAGSYAAIRWERCYRKQKEIALLRQPLFIGNEKNVIFHYCNRIFGKHYPIKKIASKESLNGHLLHKCNQ